MPGTLCGVNNSAITESDKSSCSTTNMTTFATIILSSTSDKAPTVTDNSTVYIYIVIGGMLFLFIMIVVLGVFADLSFRRMKHINSITTQPDMKL